MIEKNILCTCGGKLKMAFTDVEFFGINFGVKQCQVCTRCHSEFLSNEVMEHIEKQVKYKKLFGLDKDAHITKSGNSLVIRIPPEIVKFSGMKYKEPVRIYPAAKDRIEIELRG